MLIHGSVMASLPGIFENYTVCVMMSTSLKQRDYIIMQNVCFQMELKSLVLLISVPFEHFRVHHNRLFRGDF